ncbi:hypothetical protein CRG98_019013 [Punica granatum]|uniref:Uncharacterized protein n=1 Tax=Punica granatum TaxID=22663 RepID=A0A2I0JW50_PUNGR|nr:hypothetical protein CRG98_019013 [Punica granatum]
MVIPSPVMRDGTVKSQAIFGFEVTTVTPDGILMQGQWLPTLKRPPEVDVVVVWFQTCRADPYNPAKITKNRFQTYRVDPYSPVKITKNRVRLENRPDWAVFGSDVTTVSPDGILRQGQWLPTPTWPPEVAVVVVLRKESRINSISKKTSKTVRNFDPTGQSGCFFVLS